MWKLRKAYWGSEHVVLFMVIICGVRLGVIVALYPLVWLDRRFMAAAGDMRDGIATTGQLGESCMGCF